MPDLLSDLPVPIADQIQEVMREIKAREWVYPRLIEKGRLKAQTAEHRNAVMKAVLETLRKVERENDKAKA